MSVGRSGLGAVSLDPGTTLLVSGPVMTGKRRLVLELLARHAASADTVVVTTRKSGDVIRREFGDVAGDRGVEGLSVVDCVDAGGVRRGDRGWHRRVSDPGDLTGIGIAVTQLLRESVSGGRTVTLGVHSLSTMVMYADFRRVFQFLHVVNGRANAVGSRTVCAVDTSVVDDRELDVLTQPFDARLELRETEGGREFRVRGDDVGPRAWTPLDGATR